MPKGLDEGNFKGNKVSNNWKGGESRDYSEVEKRLVSELKALVYDVEVKFHNYIVDVSAVRPNFNSISDILVQTGRRRGIALYPLRSVSSYFGYFFKSFFNPQEKDPDFEDDDADAGEGYEILLNSLRKLNSFVSSKLFKDSKLSSKHSRNLNDFILKVQSLKENIPSQFLSYLQANLPIYQGGKGATGRNVRKVYYDYIPHFCAILDEYEKNFFSLIVMLCSDLGVDKFDVMQRDDFGIVDKIVHIFRSKPKFNYPAVMGEEELKKYKS
tara:strand:+ start:159 stop:968 length:810 start_codon:yes stop_codon:yes gene_type:complete